MSLPPRKSRPLLVGVDGELGREELKARLARAEVASEQLEAECITLQHRALDLERALALQDEGLQAYANFKAALNALLDIPRPPELTESVIDGIAELVANKLNMSPSVTMVAPLEALKKQYQQETVDRLAGEIDKFNPRQVAALKWLLAVGKASTLTEICRNLGFPTGGASFSQFSQGMKVLVQEEWVSQDPHGFKSKLNEKVGKVLAVYNPSPEDIEQTFHHLVAKLAKEQLAELPSGEDTYARAGHNRR
ncbi:MAG TPA: hypothetical protein VFR55_03380 [Dehalococcoidia bacterium]|nr:hypothetical protein [Dehalococcoidia bacterium]